jgi:hypothetical protein
MCSENNTDWMQSQLTDLDGEFTNYFSMTDERFKREWNGQYDRESLSKAKTAAVESARTIKVCQIYLSLDNKHRDWTREFVNTRRSLLLGLRDHVHWCARKLSSLIDREFLMNGIAAISLQDNRLDFRDNYVALGHLYLTSVKAGIQPSLSFQKVGLLSNPLSRTKWPTDSTQNFLTTFEESAYFKETVLPKLP